MKPEGRSSGEFGKTYIDGYSCICCPFKQLSRLLSLSRGTSNVSFACYHPELPVIISGSEDGTVKIWHANTYRLEQSLTYGLERAWCVSYQRGKQGVAVGFDDGAVVVKMGREEPAVSMDSSGMRSSCCQMDCSRAEVQLHCHFCSSLS